MLGKPLMRRLATHTCIASLCLVLAACEGKDVGGTATSDHGTTDHGTTDHGTPDDTASTAPVTTGNGEGSAGATTGEPQGTTGGPTTGSTTGEPPGGVRFPVGLGHRFRPDLGTDSGLTWAPVPGTWAPIPA